MYKSKFNEAKGASTCGTVILPVKTTVKGPAPACPTDQTDIIDEAIMSFRSNVLHTTFKQPGPADLTLCYLTIYIGELLRFLKTSPTLVEAKKRVVQMSHDNNFAIPGEDGFCLPGFWKKPESRREADQVRSYLRQMREELATRIMSRLYREGKKNKWWLQFAKRSFMGIMKTTGQ